MILFTPDIREKFFSANHILQKSTCFSQIVFTPQNLAKTDISQKLFSPSRICKKKSG